MITIIKTEYGKPYAIKILIWTIYFKKWKRKFSASYRNLTNRKKKAKRKLKIKQSCNSRHGRERVRRQLVQRDGNFCKICGAKENLTVDHIKPLHLFKGKEGDVLENKQLLCEKCHVEKTKKEHPTIDISQVEWDKIKSNINYYLWITTQTKVCQS